MKGPRSTRIEEEEKPERDDDVLLIHQLETCELGYEWERDVLEDASRRVFHLGRSLMPNERAKIAEIITRRRSR